MEVARGAFQPGNSQKYCLNIMEHAFAYILGQYTAKVDERKTLLSDADIIELFGLMQKEYGEISRGNKNYEGSIR